LGQNFAKAFDVKFLNKENKQDYVWATSWGVSTRLVGALIMAHSDDNGLVLPPKLAPYQVVIVPIYRTEEERIKVLEKCEQIKRQLLDANISVKFDDRDTYKPGWKFAEYELKGVPVRIAIGSRDMENGTMEIARRDTLTKEIISEDGFEKKISSLLDDIQSNIFKKALDFRQNNIREANSWDEFKELLEKEGGFISAHWDGTAETEEKIKEETKATIRLIPLNNNKEEGKCVYSGKTSKERVIFAKSY
jgi:prolyl-tRNA synthetase